MYKEYSQEIINDIIQKINLKDYINQYIELTRHGKDYFGICPFHNETDASFSVSTDKNIFYCFGCGAGNTIFDFVMHYHKMNFPQAVEYLIKYTGYDITNIKKDFDIVKFLRQFNRKYRNFEQVEHEILSLDILNQYKNVLIKEWIDEGIKANIMQEYGVRYDENSNRAIFPIYDNDGHFINIKGRTLYQNFKDLGVKKYLYYYPLGSNDFLYGLYKKKEIIKECNEIVLFEGSKSVWKCDGWDILNSVSLETNRINEYQIRQLLDLKCNIVIALDKGVPLNNIYQNNILKQKGIKEDFKPVLKFTNVYIVYDTNGLLKDKDSPVDRGFDIWNELYNSKIKL